MRLLVFDRPPFPLKVQELRFFFLHVVLRASIASKWPCIRSMHPCPCTFLDVSLPCAMIGSEKLSTRLPLQ